MIKPRLYQMDVHAGKSRYISTVLEIERTSGRFQPISCEKCGYTRGVKIGKRVGCTRCGAKVAA